MWMKLEESSSVERKAVERAAKRWAAMRVAATLHSPTKSFDRQRGAGYVSPADCRTRIVLLLHTEKDLLGGYHFGIVIKEVDHCLILGFVTEYSTSVKKFTAT